MNNSSSNKIHSTSELIEFLADASISPEVAALRPDYRALLNRSTAGASYWC